MKMKVTVAAAVKNLTIDPGKGSSRMQWINSIIMNLPALSVGIQTCWPACVGAVLQSADSPTGYAMSTIDISWLASIPHLAAMLSVPAWMYLVDRVGRKLCLVICSIFHVVSWLIIYLAGNMATLIVARVIYGACAGFTFYIATMYVKEISQDDLRGAMGLVVVFSRNFGALLMYIMGGQMEYYTIIYVAFAVAVATVFVVQKVPESPTFYLKIGQIETAALTMANLRNLTVDDKDVQKAINDIKAEDEKFKSIDNVTIFGIFKQKAWRKAIVCNFLLMLCHGSNGGLTLLIFTPTILEMFHVTVKPELQGLSVPIFMIIGTLISMVLIERLGRKPILVTSFVSSMLSFGALAAVVIVQRHGAPVAEWVTIVILVIPVLGFAAALSPLPYVVMAEMFNFHIRAKLMGAIVMCGWACCFAQTLIFGELSTAFGPEGAFIFFCIVNLFGTAVCLVLLPETRGKSVAEIEMELEK